MEDLEHLGRSPAFPRPTRIASPRPRPQRATNGASNARPKRLSPPSCEGRGPGPPQGFVAGLHPIDVDNLHCEAGVAEQRRKAHWLDPRVNVRRGAAHLLVGSPHRLAQSRQGIAAGNGTEEGEILFKREADRQQRAPQIVDGIEPAHRNAEVVSGGLQLQ